MVAPRRQQTFRHVIARTLQVELITLTTGAFQLGLPHPGPWYSATYSMSAFHFRSDSRLQSCILKFSYVYIWQWIVTPTTVCSSKCMQRLLFLSPFYKKRLPVSLSVSLWVTHHSLYVSLYIISFSRLFPTFISMCEVVNDSCLSVCQFYSLAAQIESFKQLSSLSSLLMDFVSQYCFKLPKKKKHHSRKRF